MQALVELLNALGDPQIALVGDYMLDRYVFGDVERISPEAPIPVLKVTERAERAGGAGNVVAAVLALGARAKCFGVAGKDAIGDRLNQLLVSSGAQVPGLIRLADYPTIVKTRYCGLAQHRNQQQILRVDEEDTREVAETIRTTLRTALRGDLRDCQMLAIQDHNKGLLGEANTPLLIADAADAGVPVIVDPARIANYGRYRGATILTPNRWEASLATGIEITDDESATAAAGSLMHITGATVIVITLDREGMFLATEDGSAQRMLTRPRSAYDGTGAGDEVLATLAVTLAAGWQPAQAVALANIAGGLEVERFGVVPIRREEIVSELRHMIGLRGGKVLPRQRLAEEVLRRRRRGDRVVFTNGCFDLLHMGHVRYLQQARELGSCLVVAINSDDSVRRLKGPQRPVIGEDERAEMLGSLECVDYVTVFEEDTPEPLLSALQPDVLVKGGTTDEIVGRQIVEDHGGRVEKLPAVEGLSTTGIIDRILSKNPQGA